MMTTKTYNGWTNYETWAVKLWLDNEESSYRYWNDVARQIKRDGPQPYPSLESSSLRREPRYILADQLKTELDESMPDLGASMWADLLNSAFAEVNWDEIAESLLSDQDDE